MLIIGHRGIPGIAPENTLSSFQRAIDFGVDMIELDVHPSKDGHLIVIHDDMLDRTTNGEGCVHDYSLADLKLLDAGNGEQVPTLDEVLDMVNRKVQVNIELREQTAELVGETIKKYLSRGRTTDEFLVSSFDHHVLSRFHTLMPEVRIGVLLSANPIDYAACATELGAYSIHVDREYITQELIDDAHHRDLQVYVWTVDDLREIEKLTHMGVDGIITNYANRLSS